MAASRKKGIKAKMDTAKQLIRECAKRAVDDIGPVGNYTYGNYTNQDATLFPLLVNFVDQTEYTFRVPYFYYLPKWDPVQKKFKGVNVESNRKDSDDSDCALEYDTRTAMFDGYFKNWVENQGNKARIPSWVEFSNTDAGDENGDIKDRIKRPLSAQPTNSEDNISSSMARSLRTALESYIVPLLLGRPSGGHRAIREGATKEDQEHRERPQEEHEEASQKTDPTHQRAAHRGMVEWRKCRTIVENAH